MWNQELSHVNKVPYQEHVVPSQVMSCGMTWDGMGWDGMLIHMDRCGLGVGMNVMDSNPTTHVVLCRR